MEFVVAKALKPSLRREFIFQQTLGEEIWCFNANANAVVAGGGGGGGGGEDFSVEDLFDFSNGDSLHHEEEQKDNSSLSSHSQDTTNSNSAAASNDSIFSTELTVPAGGLDDLEWVSHFVDDSLSLPELSLLYPVLSEQKIKFPEPEPAKKASLSFPCEVKIATKARSAKSRKPNPRVRSLSPLLSRSSSPSSCSSGLSSSSAPPPPPVAPPVKKQKRKAEEVEGAGAQSQRRCSHCQVQKTPQWRTGPLGAKTLCNACGVRYKSGRLCSEYRPACSPTFCGEIHSNSHRKVLEIRRRKEVVGPDAGLTQTQMVPTC